MAGTAPDFDAVFDRLKAILEPYAREMYVSADDARQYGLIWRPPRAGTHPLAGAPSGGGAPREHLPDAGLRGSGLLDDWPAAQAGRAVSTRWTSR